LCAQNCQKNLPRNRVILLCPCIPCNTLYCMPVEEICVFEMKLGPFLRSLFESIKRKVLWGQQKPHKLSRQTAFLPLYLFISLLCAPPRLLHKGCVQNPSQEAKPIKEEPLPTDKWQNLCLPMARGELSPERTVTLPGGGNPFWLHYYL
jgi:hypothetical protein